MNASPNAGAEIGRLLYNAVQWSMNGGSLTTFQSGGFRKLPLCSPYAPDDVKVSWELCRYTIRFIHKIEDGEGSGWVVMGAACRATPPTPKPMNQDCRPQAKDMLCPLCDSCLCSSWSKPRKYEAKVGARYQHQDFACCI